MQALIIGAGSFGSTIAREMAKRDCEVVAIDTDPNNLEALKDVVEHVVVGDATDTEMLRKFSKDADVVIVALGEKIDASVLITHRLKELGVKRIIAKSTSSDHGEILKAIGAHQIVFPERDEAIRLVANLVSPDVMDLVRLSEELNVVEVAIPTDFVGKTIADLDLRKKYGFQLLAIKNPLTGNVAVLPAPDTSFQADDVMIIVGDEKSIMAIRKV